MPLIPAVAYYRMSSDQQATSIPDQRNAVQAWAKKNGYAIQAEYADHGMSGWRDDREQFQKLIADAEKHKFAAIICWDQDRFSRFPPLEANHYWYLLDRCGVHLATVNQGRIDWSSLGGWLTASISQHGKAEYCRDLGRNVARGQATRKLKGQWIGKAPLGYKLGDNGFLAIGPPAEVATVKRIFALRCEGHGTKMIGVILNREGIAAPRGGAWSSQAIRHILQRDAYLGVVVIGKWARGKYARVVEGRKTIEGTHPAIIDRETWEAAQTMRKKKTVAHHKGDGEGAPLAGLLYCGDCGSVLYSRRFLSYGTAHYACAGGHSLGTCFHNRVDQGPMLAAVVDAIFGKVTDEDRKRIRGRVEELLKARAAMMGEAKPDDSAKRLAEINRKISAAAERILTVSPAIVPTIEAKILELQQQRATIELARKPEPAASELTVESVMGVLNRRESIVRNGRPSEIRRELSRIVRRVTIQFDTWKKTPDGRHWRKPVSAAIDLCTNEEQDSGLLFLNGVTRIRLGKRVMATTMRLHAWNKGLFAKEATKSPGA
jgi:site-specific DNA recombinase